LSISNNTNKINELIAKINSLPSANSGSTDCVSPTVSVFENNGGHTVIITDIDGQKSFFIPDGRDGSNGISPTISVETIDGGHRLNIVDVNGSKSIDIPNGSGGSENQDAVGITSIEQTLVSTASGGVNEVTVNMSNGKSSVFEVRNGEKGSDGVSCTHSWDGSVLSVKSASGTSSANLIGPKGESGDDGISVTDVTQTITSTADGGVNVVTVTLSNGNTFSFNIRNGTKGSDGDKGSNATINGVKAISINSGTGIVASQQGDTMTLSASLTEMLASGYMVLKEGRDFQYGDVLPGEDGEPYTHVKGRIFFVKKATVSE
jgi:hypothetical protein